MKFQVPQFIEVEDRIFGPLTLKQFIYLAGGAGILFALWVSLPFFLAVLIGTPIALFAAGLAFFKVNQRPFILVVEAFFNYITKKRLYIWKKQDRKAKASEQSPASDVKLPKISESRLKDLAWSLDIKESMYSNQNQR